MSEQKIVNIEQYSDNITLPTENEVLDTMKLKKIGNSQSLHENKLIKGDNMTEYITKETFNQFEKRVEQNINHLKSSIDTDIKHLNSKIDGLPSQIEDKIKIMLLEQSEKQQNERKEDRKTMIGWIMTATGISIAGTSMLIGVASFILKFFNIL